MQWLSKCNVCLQFVLRAYAPHHHHQWSTGNNTAGYMWGTWGRLRRRADTDGQGRGRRDTYPTRIESCVSLRPGGSEGPRPFLCLSEFSCLGHVSPTGSDNKSRTGAMHAFSTTARLTVPHRAQQQSSVSVTHRSRGAMPARWSNETNDPPDPVTGQASPPLHQVDTTLTMILKLRLTRTHRASSFLGPWRPWYRPYPQGSHGFLELN